MLPYTVAHISDTHIGYEAYKALSPRGENQRSSDFARAFKLCCDDIVAADPDLVVHSGDVADRTRIPVRLMMLVGSQLERLAGIRPDGSRRQVVVVAGNHELPRDRREACFLRLFARIPGVHVVTDGYEQVTFPGEGASADCAQVLRDVVVHCLPHDALKEVDFEQVVPVDGRSNLLAAHGVAGGSELYVRSLGREFAIPSSVLSRRWDYGALGHWHKQGPVPLLGTGARPRRRAPRDADGFTPGVDYLPVDEDALRGRVWYAGSTENSGFGDLRDNGTRRGWLLVRVTPGSEPKVERRFVPIRPMFRLALLDASSLSPAEIEEALIGRLREVDIASAVVGQVVEGVSRETWSLVDVARVRAAAGTALHYEVSVRYDAVASSAGPSERMPLSAARSLLAERAVVVLSDAERAGGLALAVRLLDEQLDRAGLPSGGEAVTGGQDSPAVQSQQPEPEGVNEPAAMPAFVDTAGGDTAGGDTSGDAAGDDVEMAVTS